MWRKDRWEVHTLASSDQFLYCELYHLNGEKAFSLTILYAQNQLIKRLSLWKDIEDLANNIRGPWMIIGDFNNVLTAADRIGGKDVQPTEFADLVTMMETVGLTEHDTRGDHFTWSNK